MLAGGATKKHFAPPCPFQANLRSAPCVTCQEQDVSAENLPGTWHKDHGIPCVKASPVNEILQDEVLRLG